MALYRTLQVKQELTDLSNPVKAAFFPRFFKTGKGEYGEGDIFIGVTVPNCRIVAKKNKNLKLSEIDKILHSKVHEERMTALFILVNKFKKSDPELNKEIYDFYLRNTKYINNWDLVDLSAPSIVGAYLFDKPKHILHKLAVSESLWEKRIAIVATYYFIKQNQFKDTLIISKLLLSDKHDLIHKAVGWMLREVGKRDIKLEEQFLKTNYSKMPRTTLRYAIEKFPEDKRRKFLHAELKSRL